MLALCRRVTALRSFITRCRVYGLNRYCSNDSTWTDRSDELTDKSRRYDSNGGGKYGKRLSEVYKSPLLWQDQPRIDSRDIQVVDSDTWRVSSGLARLLKENEYGSQLRLFGGGSDGSDGVVSNCSVENDDPDIDEIEDLRMEGKLFYKIDRNSKEFEEYNYEFHRRKGSSNRNDSKESSKNKVNLIGELPPKSQKSLKEGVLKKCSKKGNAKEKPLINEERLVKTIKENYIVNAPNGLSDPSAEKKKRKPTYNQLTGPYHEPFCLDIQVSKGSVRACVVHRATSKVVVVAHSISKDLKYDVGSTKSVVAAEAVGKILAQRALEDDIHDVIYIPRKGDKLEGKLQVVLQSIIDQGVNVKVKIKQRNPSKATRKKQVLQ